jgi:gamma-glutamyltranspeptidase/glutathione hydrolase
LTDEAVYSRVAVAAPHVLAAEAGRDALAQGGNAIEAMVAMAATIAVVYPHMNAIGGDGFWLIREPNGKARAIEACGFAGEGATIERYRALGFDAIPPRGPNAALTVPGTIGGWTLALELSAALGGRLPLRVLLEPAEKFAREGVAVSAAEARLPLQALLEEPGKLARGGIPASASEARFNPAATDSLIAAPGFAATYLIDGKPAPAGAIRKQTRLADTLAQLADAGLEDFYRGDVAREIAADLQRIGSPVTRADLKNYHAAWREPLSVRLKNAVVYNTPAPTQGIASLILLGLYERLGVRNVDGFEHAHALIEGFKRAQVVRDRVCVDFSIATDDFARLTSPAFLESEAAKVDRRRSAPWPLPVDQGDTIWMGAIDESGLAVSFIQSGYWEFGSGCVLERTGILMQNRGVAFPLDVRARNALRPGRRPFHTLNPPLGAFDDGRVLSYGSMGGDGQPQFQAQVFTRINAGQKLADAVAAPRHVFGRTWGAGSASVKLEAGYDDSIASALARAGHEIERRQPKDCDSFGHAGALLRSPKAVIAATHDPRSDGGSAGF